MLRLEFAQFRAENVEDLGVGEREGVLDEARFGSRVL